MSYGDNRAPRVVNIWAGSNPWGYRFNVNHSMIKSLYKRYQQAHGLDTTLPMTDAQRHDFERQVYDYLSKKGII